MMFFLNKLMMHDVHVFFDVSLPWCRILNPPKICVTTYDEYAAKGGLTYTEASTFPREWGPAKVCSMPAKGNWWSHPAAIFWLVLYFWAEQTLQNKAQTPSTKQGAPFGFQVHLYYIIYTYKSRTVSFVQIRSSKGNARLDMIESNTFSRLCALLKWFADFRVSVELQLFITVAKPWKSSAIFSRLQSWGWCTHTEIFRDNIFLGNTHADLLKIFKMLGQRVKHIILGGGLMVIYHSITFKENTLNKSKALEKWRFHLKNPPGMRLRSWL